MCSVLQTRPVWKETSIDLLEQAPKRAFIQEVLPHADRRQQSPPGNWRQWWVPEATVPKILSDSNTHSDTLGACCSLENRKTGVSFITRPCKRVPEGRRKLGVKIKELCNTLTVRTVLVRWRETFHLSGKFVLKAYFWQDLLYLSTARQLVASSIALLVSSYDHRATGS